jgi:hypothetical protein
MLTRSRSTGAGHDQLSQDGDLEALLTAALRGIVSVEPIPEDGTIGELSSPCVYCWRSGPMKGAPEGRHAPDCEWIEARAALNGS